MTILNISHQSTLLYGGGEYVARGISSGQSSTKVLTQRTALKEKEHQRLNEMFDKYKDCFATNNSELGNTNVEIKIRLTNTTPLNFPQLLNIHDVRKFIFSQIHKRFCKKSQTS